MATTKRNTNKHNRIITLGEVTNEHICDAIEQIYSLATGMSTSVIRSANMLSIMVVGETLNKKGFSVNTLAASALIQCILHPVS